MTVNKKNISAAIVHYKTFEITRCAIYSIHNLYPDLSIAAVENNSNDGSLEELNKLKKEIPSLVVFPQENNLHHGPGLNFAFNKIQTNWILTFDSDCILFRRNFIEELLGLISKNVYAVGKIIEVNRKGFAPLKGEESFKYVHPYCSLVNREKYLTLPPFEKSGAPCLRNYIAAANNGFEFRSFPVDDYIYHIGSGTMNKAGYGLGLSSKMEYLKYRVKKAFYMK